MFYTIYKTTNKIDGKFYIGKHQAKDLDDGYMGSGKYLKRAIEKHGIENFDKEILFVFDNETDMNAKEAELVTDAFVKEDTNYNLCPGGEGGFGYINNNNIGNIGWKHNLNSSEHQQNGGLAAMKNPDNRKKVSYNMKEAHKAGKMRYDGFKDQKHSDVSRKKMSDAKTGVGNSQYGKMWIYSLTERKSIRINKDAPVPDGWHKGRKMKFDLATV